MRCRKVIPLISEYIDQELAREISCVVERHIFECQRCSSLLNTMEVTIRLARTRKREIPDERIMEITELIIFRLFGEE